MEMIDPGKLRDIFDQAVGLPMADRAAFLEQVCGANAPLRREVERLLSADVRFGTVFDTRPPSDASGAPEASRAPSGACGLSLASGTRLGPYVITAPLGAGGMGEVYKARDARLDRTVALKVLPRDLIGDPTAKQRFEREARAVAALSHPHICPLFDIGHQEGTDFLVMEYLEGETLATRLARGKLPLNEVLTFGLQIAQGLAAAHRAGIVHRDLKPGNIMVTTGGIKLLDFGLAKRRQPAVVDSVTVEQPQPLTHRGMILGTLQYMAPEQLEGHDADERTDIFAFGVVLYEMVTGRKAFDGTSDAALIGHILHADPPAPSSIESLTPPLLDEVVRVCLAKDPNARWQSLADIETRLATAREVAVPAPRSSANIRWIGLVAAVLLTAAIAGLGWREWARSQSTSPPREGGQVQRNLTRLTFDSGLQTDPTFSPDGRFIAYASDKAGNFDIWVQLVSGGDPVQITRSAAQDTQPAWSPDGTTIVFRSDRDGGGLYLVSALGGPERLLVNFGAYPSWSPDGSEVRFLAGWSVEFAKGNTPAGFYAISLKGDLPKQIQTEFTRSGVWAWIAAHPDGRTSFVGVHKKLGFGFFTVSDDGRITKSKQIAGANLLPNLTISSNDRHRFGWNAGGTALYVESIAGQVRNLWRVRVDSDTLAWRSAERLTTGAGADVAAAVSRDGTHVVFSSLQESDRLWSFPLDPIGRRLGEGHPVSEEAADSGQADLASDGMTVAYTMWRLGAPSNVLWLTHLDTGHSQLLASDAGSASWSRDGQRIAYTKWKPDTVDPTSRVAVTALAVRTVTGPERLISPWNTKATMAASDWTPDGRALLVALMKPDSATRLVLWPVTGGVQEPTTVMSDARASFWQAKYSPNGRWLSFVVFRDKAEVAVTRAGGGPESEWIRIAADHVSPDKPRWSSDGKRLYFLSKQGGSFLNLWGVQFDSERGIPLGNPFRLTAFNSPGFIISSDLQYTELGVSDRRVVMTMHTAAGNIWMLDNADR